MYLIVGLGNPEEDYSNTRHNMGFNTINKLAKQYNIEIGKKKFYIFGMDDKLFPKTTKDNGLFSYKYLHTLSFDSLVFFFADFFCSALIALSLYFFACWYCLRTAL